MRFAARQPHPSDVQAEKRQRRDNRTGQGEAGQGAQFGRPDGPGRGFHAGRRRLRAGRRGGQVGRRAGRSAVVRVGRVRVGFRR